MSDMPPDLPDRVIATLQAETTEHAHYLRLTDTAWRCECGYIEHTHCKPVGGVCCEECAADFAKLGGDPYTRITQLWRATHGQP